jgi:hypothetical protein
MSKHKDPKSCVSSESFVFLYAHCFFKHRLKANSLSSLCRPKPTTNASTQNLQTHPPIPRAVLVRHSSLNFMEFKTKIWWVHSSRHFNSFHLKPIQINSVILTRTLSNLFAKKNSDSFLQA